MNKLVHEVVKVIVGFAAICAVVLVVYSATYLISTLLAMSATQALLVICMILVLVVASYAIGDWLDN